MKKENYIFDSNTLAHIAELSKLDISPEEAELMTSQMQQIIDFASEICRAEIIYHQTDTDPVPSDKLRVDIPEPTFCRDELLQASNQTDNGYFSVPEVFENGGTK